MYEGEAVTQVVYAPRGMFAKSDGLNLLVVENGKPNAKRLLTFIAEEIKRRLPVATIEIHSKPSAGRPIDADLVKMFAARSHLLISGLGD